MRLWTFAAAGLAADLASKHWAFSHLDPYPDPSRPPRTLIPGVVSLYRTLNPGALFGMGSGLWFVFILASLLALAFVLYLFANSTRERISLHIGLGLILAGAVGNLYDRAFVQADVIYTKEGRVAGIIKGETDDTVILAAWPEGTTAQPIRKSEILERKRQGVVRDFIKFDRVFGMDVWPWVFNVADVLLVVGVVLLLWNFWLERREVRRAAATVARESATANAP